MENGSGIYSFGIAVNFTGNYRQSGNNINQMLGRMGNAIGYISTHAQARFNNAMARMRASAVHFGNALRGFNRNFSVFQSLLISGAIYGGLRLITGGVRKLTTSLYELGTTMETQFAKLKTVLGGTAQAMETLAWARKKGVETPFEISEVNAAIEKMTTFGFNKNKAMREKVFTAVGDFAGTRGMGFEEAMAMVAKAGFGNPRQLMMRTGLHPSTMGMNIEQAKVPEAEKKAMREWNKILQTGKKGSEEYKMAWVELLGALHKGGMENRMQTVSGAMSNVNDLMENFMMDIVGYSQVSGTLFNSMAKTIKNKFLAPFSQVLSLQVKYRNNETLAASKATIVSILEKRGLGLLAEKIKLNKILTEDETNRIKEVTGLTLKQITVSDRLSQAGSKIGNALRMLWGSVDKWIGRSTNKLVDYILKLDNWLSDFKGNVAPMLVYLVLLADKIKRVFKSFWDGFKQWSWVKDLLLGVFGLLGKIINLVSGKTGSGAENVAKGLGWTLGLVFALNTASRLWRILGRIKSFAKGTSILLNGEKAVTTATKSGGLIGKAKDWWFIAQYRALELSQWAGKTFGKSGALYKLFGKGGKIARGAEALWSAITGSKLVTMGAKLFDFSKIAGVFTKAFTWLSSLEILGTSLSTIFGGMVRVLGKVLQPLMIITETINLFNSYLPKLGAFMREGGLSSIPGSASWIKNKASQGAKDNRNAKAAQARLGSGFNMASFMNPTAIADDSKYKVYNSLGNIYDSILGYNNAGSKEDNYLANLYSSPLANTVDVGKTASAKGYNLENPGDFKLYVTELKINLEKGADADAIVKAIKNMAKKEQATKGKVN